MGKARLVDGLRGEVIVDFWVPTDKNASWALEKLVKFYADNAWRNNTRQTKTPPIMAGFFSYLNAIFVANFFRSANIQTTKAEHARNFCIQRRFKVRWQETVRHWNMQL